MFLQLQSSLMTPLEPSLAAPEKKRKDVTVLQWVSLVPVNMEELMKNIRKTSVRHLWFYHNGAIGWVAVKVPASDS